MTSRPWTRNPVLFADIDERLGDVSDGLARIVGSKSIGVSRPGAWVEWLGGGRVMRSGVFHTDGSWSFLPKATGPDAEDVIVSMPIGDYEFMDIASRFAKIGEHGRFNERHLFDLLSDTSPGSEPLVIASRKPGGPVEGMMVVDRDLCLNAVDGEIAYYVAAHCCVGGEDQERALIAAALAQARADLECVVSTMTAAGLAMPMDVAFINSCLRDGFGSLEDLGDHLNSRAEAIWEEVFPERHGPCPLILDDFRRRPFADLASVLGM